MGGWEGGRGREGGREGGGRKEGVCRSDVKARKLPLSQF